MFNLISGSTKPFADHTKALRANELFDDNEYSYNTECIMTDIAGTDSPSNTITKINWALSRMESTKATKKDNEFERFLRAFKITVQKFIDENANHDDYNLSMELK